MVLTLYRTSNVSADLAAVARRVNDLQHLFAVHVVQAPMRLPKNLSRLFTPNPSLIGQWFQSRQATLGSAQSQMSVLATSNSLGLPGTQSIYRQSAHVTLLSDHNWQTNEEATTILFLRHVLKIGMESFGCHTSQVKTCICSS